MNSHEHKHEEGRPRRGLATKWVLLGFILIGAYLLVTEHRAHVIPYRGPLQLLVMRQHGAPPTYQQAPLPR